MSKKSQPDMRKFRGAPSEEAGAGLTVTAMQMVDPDSRVQAVYDILISGDRVPDSEMPWERWVARRIVGALSLLRPAAPSAQDSAAPSEDQMEGVLQRQYCNDQAASAAPSSVSAEPDADSPIGLKFATEQAMSVLDEVLMYGGEDLGPSVITQVKDAIEFCERALLAPPAPAAAPQAGELVATLHREWRSALAVAIETLETEREHRIEGGHDDDARKMKRAETVLRAMLATPSPAVSAEPVALEEVADSLAMLLCGVASRTTPLSMAGAKAMALQVLQESKVLRILAQPQPGTGSGKS